MLELLLHCILYSSTDDEEDDSYFEVTTETPAIVTNSRPEAHDGSSVLSKVFSAALKSQDKSRYVS